MIKLNNRQANKIAGIYNNIWVVGAIYVEDNFWIVNDIKDFNDNYAIAKRYLKRLIDSGKASVVNMSIDSTERRKIQAALNSETRSEKIEYKGKYIVSEL